MANVQPKDGQTWIANELIEEVFAKGKFSKRESQIIWIILRDSWGWVDKRPKTIKKYGKRIRKYMVTKRSLSYSQLSERTGLALPHIGEIVTNLKNRKVIKEHWSYYKFNKNYDGYQKSNLTYQNSNQSKEVTKMVSKSYQNGNKRLPKWEPKVTKIVTSTPSKPTARKEDKTLKELKEDLKKERTKILFQINKLKSQLPLEIQSLVEEYIELARAENKTNRILPNKEKRLVNELYKEWFRCESDEASEVLLKDFEAALKVTINNEAPSINYLKKVMKSRIKKRKVRLKKAHKTWK